jgi:hypothetical protein
LVMLRVQRMDDAQPAAKSPCQTPGSFLLL